MPLSYCTADLFSPTASALPRVFVLKSLILSLSFEFFLCSALIVMISALPMPCHAYLLLICPCSSPIHSLRLSSFTTSLIPMLGLLRPFQAILQYMHEYAAPLLVAQVKRRLDAGEPYT